MLVSLTIKIGCRESPVCLCGFHTETVKYYVLDCPLYSALRIKRTVILADKWATMSESQLISAFLLGAPFLSLNQNSDLSCHVQSLVSESMRFHRKTQQYAFHMSTPFFTLSPFECVSAFCTCFFSLPFLIQSNFLLSFVNNFHFGSEPSR